MRLALMIEGQEDVSWEQWVALAGACEEHGIDSLFRSDHYGSVMAPDSGRGSLDAWGTLCALAAVTTTVRLGTMVSPATFRHPSLVAKLVTTADRISGGRVELGLGAGWNELEHAAYGFPLPPMRERLDVLDEQLQVVHGNWSAGPFSFAGEHYVLEDLSARPRPVQEPHPPLIMGGLAGPRSAALAARYADEYNTVHATPEQARERGARLAAACEAVGRDPLPLSVMTFVMVAEDEASLRARADRLVARDGLADSGAAFLASLPEGWIAGTVDEVAAQLRALEEAGVSRMFCQHLLHDDLDGVALLGERVGPLVA